MWQNMWYHTIYVSIFSTRSDLLRWSLSRSWSFHEITLYAYLICQKRGPLSSSLSRIIMKRWLFNIIWKTDFRTHQCDKICGITQYISPSLVQQSDLLRWSWSGSWSFHFKWSFGWNDLDHLSDLDLWSRSLFMWSSRALLIW